MLLDLDEKLDDWSLDPLQSVAPQLRLILRSRIIRNDLQPMDRLSEPEIAKKYNVSRQPVREAFITLVNEGLLEIRPQRGTYVKRIDYKNVLNGQFVREAVEADIVRTLANNPSPVLIGKLRNQLKDQKNIDAGHSISFKELDEKFHLTLAHEAGVADAWRYLEAIKSQMDRVRFISFEEFPIMKLVDQHEHIADMIEDGNVASAEEAIRTHIREILKSLPEIYSMYPQYFEGSP